jgi:hypothetical protein
MKSLLFIILLSPLIACVQQGNPISPVEEDVLENGEINKYIDPCMLDLRVKEGDYQLKRGWEFMGFLDPNTGKLDHLTCLARSAYMNFNEIQKEDEKIRKLLLTFYDEPAEDCGNGEILKAVFFSYQWTGCFQQAEEEGIKISLKSDSLLNSYGSILPIVNFEDKYRKALEKIESFEIIQNKLMLYTQNKEDELVFIAVD